jgi:crotonobetainyl-CoA:carnitine CoA-transferase CaiB-like acyl-CoA transferase
VSGSDGRPFAGLRVLDFGVGGVGVEVGRLFADYGADVIKVESGTAPDFMRAIMPGGMNPAFASSSRNKRSLGVNVKTPRGLALVERLIRDADVMIENNGSEVMERLGLGPERVRALNPRIVYFRSSLPGSRGPWKSWTGYGPSTHPVSGLQWLWNYPEDADRPAGSTNIFPDHLVGRVGAFAAVAGLIARERTGRGVVAEAAQFEVAVQYLGDLFALESLAPGSVRPQGNASMRGAPWGVYPCAGDDEWCAICVRSEAEWQGLRAELGDPAWARRPELATGLGRVTHRAEIDEHLVEWTRELPPHQVMERLQARGIAVGVVQHARHHLVDPHLADRGYHLLVEQKPIGTIVLEGPAFHGSDLPEPPAHPAPMLGEHTRELARELLGMPDAEIEALLREGVLEEWKPEPAA